MTSDGTILAGVSGGDGSRAAIRYAAHQAKVSGADLRIVHVAPDYVPLTALYPMALPFEPVEMEAIGRAILADAVKDAEAYLPPGRISTTLVVGDRVAGLLGAIGEAGCVILGDDRAPLLRRVATGSTIAGVAGRAEVPVVVVPSDWQPREPHRGIAVALKTYDPLPADLVRGALRIAAARGARLDIVHVWDPPPRYGDQLGLPARHREWAESVTQSLRHSAAPLAAEYRNVEITFNAYYGDPASVLEQVSAGVDLILVARRARAFPTGHFGSVGRALLRGVRCPLVVLPISEGTEETRSVTVAEGPWHAGTPSLPQHTRPQETETTDVASTSRKGQS